MESYKKELRKKIFDMADFIAMSYYVSNPNMEIGERSTNDVIMYSLMTGLLNRNQLITGNYGLGKTTTAQAVSSLLFGFPIEFVEKGMIRGHPQLTEEKVFGRLDFSKLSETEKVIFSTFAQTPSAKIIDEINRIPPGTQNMLLDCIESGNFLYLNESIDQDKMPFFATANYSDRGNTKLTPPLMDRFDVSVEVQFPLFLQGYIRSDIDESRLGKGQLKKLKILRSSYESELHSILTSGSVENLEKAKQKFEQAKMEILGFPMIDAYKGMLSDRPLSSKMQEIVCDKNISYESKLEKLAGMSASFSERFEGSCLAPAEKKAFPYLLHVQDIEPDAGLLLDAFFDHMNSELKAGENDSAHYKEYSLGKVMNNPSTRASVRSCKDYAKCLSFLKGENSVSLETVKEVLPYAINHRLEFSDKFRAEADDYMQSSMQMGLARQLVEDFVEEDFSKNREEYRKMYKALLGGDTGKFLNKHKDSDNPLFRRLYHLSK